jgi:hypothetical protein
MKKNLTQRAQSTPNMQKERQEVLFAFLARLAIFA